MNAFTLLGSVLKCVLSLKQSLKLPENGSESDSMQRKRNVPRQLR
jgi:hypothetical protein